MDQSAPAPPPPTRVASPSGAGETRAALRAALLITCAALLSIAARRGSDSGHSAGLLPWQLAFADLEPANQRRFRAMQEGLVELERQREDGGTWAPVERLAADLVPPFAPDPIEPAGYAWTRAFDGRFASYFGVPTGAAPALLIHTAEPDPVAPEVLFPGAPLDPTHRLLADGTLLHVSLWMHLAPGLEPDRLDPNAPLPDPALSGWTQIVTEPEPTSAPR